MLPVFKVEQRHEVVISVWGAGSFSSISQTRIGCLYAICSTNDLKNFYQGMNLHRASQQILCKDWSRCFWPHVCCVWAWEWALPSDQIARSAVSRLVSLDSQPAALPFDLVSGPMLRCDASGKSCLLISFWQRMRSKCLTCHLPIS